LIIRLLTASEKKHFTFAGGLTKVIMLSGICYLFLYRIELLHSLEVLINILKHASE